MSCPASTVHSDVLHTVLQTCKLPRPLPLMFLSLTPGSFFGLEVGQVQGLQACRVQPSNWQRSQETKETPMSAEILGNKDEGGKLQGHPLTCEASKLWV